MHFQAEVAIASQQIDSQIRQAVFPEVVHGAVMPENHRHRIPANLLGQLGVEGKAPLRIVGDEVFRSVGLVQAGSHGHGVLPPGNAHPGGQPNHIGREGAPDLVQKLPGKILRLNPAAVRKPVAEVAAVEPEDMDAGLLQRGRKMPQKQLYQKISVFHLQPGGIRQAQQKNPALFPGAQLLLQQAHSLVQGIDSGDAVSGIALPEAGLLLLFVVNVPQGADYLHGSAVGRAKNPAAEQLPPVLPAGTAYPEFRPEGILIGLPVQAGKQLPHQGVVAWVDIAFREEAVFSPYAVPGALQIGHVQNIHGMIGNVVGEVAVAGIFQSHPVAGGLLLQ